MQRQIFTLFLLVTLVAATTAVMFPPHLGKMAEIKFQATKNDDGTFTVRQVTPQTYRTVQAPGWQNADSAHSRIAPTSVGRAQNCNRAQMIQFLQTYQDASHGDTQAQTGYDFSPVFPFFNATTPDAFNFRLIDNYYTHGANAFIQSLVFYPPWLGQVYATATPYIPYDFAIDDVNCRASQIINRTLTNFVDFKVDVEVNKADFFFANNRRDGQAGGNRPYGFGSGEVPDILVNQIIEQPNAARLASEGSVFEIFAHDNEQLCSLYEQYCSLVFPGLVDWADANACLAYMSTRDYTIGPHQVVNPIGGDTTTCRNYFMAYRIGGDFFNESPETLYIRCLLIGPSTGPTASPYGQCTPHAYDGA
jgi:hypothetical protein